MKKKKPYHSKRETKFTRELLDKACTEYLKRKANLPLFPSNRQKSHASIGTVAKKFGMARTTLGYYINHKLK